MTGGGGGGAGGGAGAGGAAAAAAGQAGGDAGQQQGQQDGGGEAQGGFDPAQLSAALEALHGGQEDLRTLLQSAQQGEPGQDGQEPIDGDGFDDGELGLDDGYEDGEPFGDELGGEPGELAEQLADSVDGYVKSATEPIQRQLAEQQQQLADERLSREYQQLAAEFPAMGDPSILREMTETAQAIGEQIGLEPRQALSPSLLRIVFMASQAAEIAQEESEREGSGDPEAAHIEGAGGAAPSAGRQGGDRFDRMLGQRRGSQALPWGAGS